MKVEFTYYPFTRISPSIKLVNLPIDSVLDIATNMLFTIISDTGYGIDELIVRAKSKFDWHVDKLQLGKQFLSVQTDSDKPRFCNGFAEAKCKEFFLNESRKLGLSAIK